MRLSNNANFSALHWWLLTRSVVSRQRSIRSLLSGVSDDGPLLVLSFQMGRHPNLLHITGLMHCSETRRNLIAGFKTNGPTPTHWSLNKDAPVPRGVEWVSSMFASWCINRRHSRHNLRPALAPVPHDSGQANHTWPAASGRALRPEALTQDLQRSPAASSAAPSLYPFLLFRGLFCVGLLLRTRFNALT